MQFFFNHNYQNIFEMLDGDVSKTGFQQKALGLHKGAIKYNKTCKKTSSYISYTEQYG